MTLLVDRLIAPVEGVRVRVMVLLFGNVHESVVIDELSAFSAPSSLTQLVIALCADAAAAFLLYFANWGIAIDAKMPIIATTIKSSINVKPSLFFKKKLAGKFPANFLLWRTGNFIVGNRAAN